MTQQYLVGQLSALLGDLEGEVPAWRTDMHGLRRVIESSPPVLLPELAAAAIRLSDGICWALLERGEFDGFRRCAASIAQLADFMDSADLV